MGKPMSMMRGELVSRLVTQELVQMIDEKVRQNRRFTISELSHQFPQISRALLHKVITEDLGYRKFCA
jgi:hypothetical protein